MKKFNILRIGNFPTTKYNTVGMHAYYANFCKQFRVLQISSKVEGNPIKIPKGRYCATPLLNPAKLILSIITTNRNKTASAPT